MQASYLFGISSGDYRGELVERYEVRGRTVWKCGAQRQALPIPVIDPRLYTGQASPERLQASPLRGPEGAIARSLLTSAL